MFRSLSGRLQTLSADVRSLTGNHWHMLKEEVAGSVKLTKQQLIMLAAGGTVALTGVVLLLVSLTLFLSQLLVSMAGMEPLLATATGAGIMALLFAAAGAILAVRAGGKLTSQRLAPVHTLHSFSASVQALASTPALTPPLAAPVVTVTPASEASPILPPNNITPPASEHLINNTKPMNTRQNFETPSGTAEESVHRVKQNLGDALYNLTQKVEINPLAAAAIDWVSTYLDQRGGRQPGAQSLGGSLSRAVPLSPAALGLAGIGYLLWQQLTRPAARQAAADFVDYGRERARGFTGQARQAYQDGADTVSSAGQRAREAAQSAREAVNETTHRWADTARGAAATVRDTGAQVADRARSYYETARHAAEDGVEHLSDTAGRLRRNAEDGYERAKDFAQERPAAAAAAGVLAVGLAALLIRGASRR